MTRGSYNLLELCQRCKYELAAHFVPLDSSVSSENYLLAKRVPGEWRVACQNPACDYVWGGSCKNLNELKFHGFNIEEK
jgi:hypothetical protein